MNSLRLALLQARKTYSKCANKLESAIKDHGLSKQLSEQVIGIGIAADWVRHAAEMESINYVGAILNKSRRKMSFEEVQRFGFSWFGLNAIFTRPALLKLVGQPQKSGEFEQFLVLLRNASLPDAMKQTTELQGLLATPVSTRLPTLSGTSVSTLNAIETKYLSHRPPAGRTARLVSDAATSGNLAQLDLSTLLYAFRNWSVHGNALDGCFGSRPGFVRYVDILQQVLAEVHVATAQKLHANV